MCVTSLAQCGVEPSTYPQAKQPALPIQGIAPGAAVSKRLNGAAATGYRGKGALQHAIASIAVVGWAGALRLFSQQSNESDLRFQHRTI